MDSPSRTHNKSIKKSLTFNANHKPHKKSRKSQTSHKKKGRKVKRESVLKPSVYQKIQKKRKSQIESNKARESETFSKSSSICSTLSTTSNICDNRRIVFISLISFYKCWRFLPANILNDCILILPLYREWIIQPLTNRSYSTQYNTILNDSQFIQFLQWKDKQTLIFYMLNHLNRKITIENAIKYQNQSDCNNIAPFWHNLSLKLQTLYDPDTCDSYRPLLLNQRWWKYAYTNMYQTKYNVSSQQVLNELYFLTMKFECIQEILYQSNPSLNVVIQYRKYNTNNFNISKGEINALQCIKCILNEPLNNEPLNMDKSDIISVINEEELMNIIPKIDIKSNVSCISNEFENYLSCDTLQSPSNNSNNSNNSSSSHIINKNNIDLMNSGSESELKINYNSPTNDNKNESVTSSDIFANMTHNNIINNKNNSISNNSINSSDSLDDNEWWVCPDYYYDTYKKNDIDCDTDY